MEVGVVIPVTAAQLDTVEAAIVSALENGIAPNNIKVYWDGSHADYCRLQHLPQIYKNVNTHTHYGRFSSGVCAARNYCINLLPENALVLPLDSDDILLPGAVSALMWAYTPGAVVYGDWLEGPAKIKAPPASALWRKHVCHATYLFSRESWVRAGGYDIDFNIGAEDWDFLLNLVSNGAPLIHVDAPIYQRAINDTGRTSKAYQNRVIISELLKSKYGERFNALAQS